MIKKRLAAGFLTAAMALTLCMGTGMTAMAAGGDDPVNLDDARGAVTKNLIMDENVTTPNATFKFTIEKATGTVTDETGADVTKFLSTDGPELSIDPITFTKENTGTTSEGVKTVKGEARIRKADGGVLSPGTFPHAGIYAYRIKEVADTYSIADDTQEKMIYSEAEYTVFIAISNRADYGGGLKIESITGMITVDDAGTDIKDEKVDSTEPGSSDLAFQNIYSKTGGTGEDPKDPEDPDDPGWEDQNKKALSISKTVTGKYGDHDADFDFTLTLYKHATMDAEVAQSGGDYPTYTVSLPDGTDLKFQFEKGKDSVEQNFTLKHGQKIIFDDVPVGTKFTLSENDGQPVVNYDTTISGKSDGAEFNEAAMTVSNKLVGEGVNYADVTNDFDENPITGILVDNLPFIILIGAAVAGFAAYIIVRRRSFIR